MGETGSTNVLNIDDLVISTRGKSKPSKKTWLKGLVVFLLFLSILFAALFAVFYVKSTTDDDDDGDNDGDNAPRVCTSADCVYTASLLLDHMDLEADPCQDFSQFVCGRFYKNKVLADNEAYSDLFKDISNRNEDVSRLILRADIQPGEKSYVTKMKQFYRMCMDTDTIENIGLRPYLDSEYFKEWPTLNSDWNASTFNLNDVTAKYESLLSGSKILFDYNVGPDPSDSSKNVLKIRKPIFCQTTRHSMACQNYYVDVALTLGADNVTAKKDAAEVLDFQIKLAKIPSQTQTGSNKSTQNNPMTLDEMTREFPPIDWLRTFRAVFQTAGIFLKANTTVIIESPTYLASLDSVLNTTPSRVLQNFFSFNYADAILKDLTESLRTAGLRMMNFQDKNGVTELSPRWKQCVNEVRSTFKAGLSKKFVSRTFSPQSRTFVDTLLTNVKTEFRQQLKNANWMENKTKEAAIKKLHALTHKIGYPDENFDEEYIDNLYTNVTIMKGKFAENRMDLMRRSEIVDLHAITRKVDKSNWQSISMEVNVQNVPTANEIRFYTGILQPTFYSEAFPRSINYGSVGYMIGHELTHFFDTTGNQYDENGNVKNWWMPSDLQRFKEKVQCLIDQYSAFVIPEISEHLNGKLTIDETTADSGGVKSAFKAFKKLSSTGEKELPLPGLNLTLDQQFFVATGLFHCSVHTDSDFRVLLQDVHPPGKYRIIGTLQNSLEFAQTFNCPAGSHMNPIKKCQVW